MAIGAKGNAGSSAVAFDGLIDEVRIYKRALTDSQVLQEFNSGTPDYNTIVASETNQGDQWSLALYLTDIFSEATINAPAITVAANTLPTVTGSVSVPGGGNLNANGVSLSSTPLDTDGTTPTETITWLRNNGPITPLNMPFDIEINTLNAGDILDFSTLDNHGQLGGGTLADAPTWVASGKKEGHIILV